MSIIYEALKKIEKKEDKDKPLFTKHLFKYIFVIVVGIVLFSFFSISIYFSRPKTKTASFFTYSTSKIFPLPEVQNDQSKTAASVKYRLQGIIYDKDRPIALINGKKLGIGDNIEGARVVNISGNGVELETKEGKVYIPW